MSSPVESAAHRAGASGALSSASPLFRPALNALRIGLFIVLPFAAVLSFGQTREDLKKPLSEAVNKALMEFVDRCVPEKRKQLILQMDEELKAVDAAAKLTTEETAALKKQAAKAIETSLTAWRPRIAEECRRYLPRMPESTAIRHIRESKPDETGLALVEDWAAPDEDPTWIEAIRSTVGDERFAAWQSIDRAKRKARDAEIAEYVKRWIDECRVAIERSFRLKTEQFSKAVNADGRSLDELNAAALAAMEKFLRIEEIRATGMLRPMPDAARTANIARSSLSRRFYLGALPQWDILWQEELKRTVTSEELAAWTHHLAEEKMRFERELPTLLRPMLTEMRERSQKALDLETSFMVTLLGIEPDRSKRLKAAAKTAIDRAEQRWTALAKEQAGLLDNDTRQQILKRGSYYIAVDESDLLQNDPAWKDAVSTLLSADELKQLETAKSERNVKRVRIMGQIMLAELDQRVAFTASQRVRLQPIAERLAKDVPELFREHRSNYGYDLRPQLFFAAASKAVEKEVAAILDAAQWLRWQEACKAPDAETARQQEIMNPDAAAKQPPPEPEHVEHEISDFLNERTRAERHRLIADMTLRVEDATRVAGLTDKVAARLQTAAKGAAENVLGAWKSAGEQTVRSILTEATAQNMQQRLGGIDAHHFNRGVFVQPATHRLWTATVESELTAPQRAAWQREIEARTDFRHRTLTSAVVAEFDRRHMLTPEQWRKLEPAIAKIVTDYSRDLDSSLSGSSTPWYLQSYGALLPFVGVAEKELKEVLAKEQWERWSGEDFANFASYWESIKQQHDHRAKSKK